MPKFNPRRWLGIGGLAAAALALVVAATLAHDGLFHARPLSASPGPEGERPPGEAPAAAAGPSHVALSEAKVEAAGIRVASAEMTPLAVEIALPATIEPNVDRRVMIRPRVMGVIREVNVLLGQTVRAGDRLAVLDSPDVGTARLELKAKVLDLDLARVEYDWAETIARNVEELIYQLGKEASARNLEKLFADKPLGTRRSELLASYADLEIARHEEEKQTDLFKKKIVGEHPAFLAVHTREGAQAKFEAALEQVKFDAAQQKRRADQVVRRAEAAVQDATQRLRILNASASPEGAGDDPDVTAFPMVAPFDGTITARSAVPSQRVETTDVLFTLVDLTTVRVAAHVPESGLSALSGLVEGGPLTVAATAYPGETFDARTIYVGREVDPMTRTVTLLAEVPNPEGRLRPGMFARIVVAGAQAETALTVPAGAVVELEGKSIVFVPGEEAGAYAVRHVEAGREADGRRVILAGVQAGEAVVASGAFALKSELILQNEPEED